ncbi:hypothetical protein BASA81_010297 [Batrachochytrium salamandrivorans]|nr:hypothetical protein BASA81_010297 [Batrachochytrium salamandrivorans]
MAECFFELDEDLLQIPALKDGSDRSGCTALAVSLTHSHVVFCNAGDSRAIFVGNAGRVMFATEDHKPDNEVELNRITKAGGAVYDHRVNGDLAVSRALGDFKYKCQPGVEPAEQPVTCKPDITLVPRRHELDEFVLLACDGIWDVMSNEAAAQFVYDKMVVGFGMGRICELLLDHCLELGSRDNMSVVIVALPNAPQQIGTYREPAPPSPASAPLD